MLLAACFRSRNRNGGVAPMLALAALPLFGFVGAAVDYSRAASARTAMQAALDATALMLSKDAQTLTDAPISARRPTDYFKAHVQPPGSLRTSRSPRSSASPQQGNFTLKLTGSAKVNTMFCQAARPVARSTLSASAEVLWGIKKLNLALALDNTGSMASSGKMTDLKTAAHNLLTTLKNAAKTPGDIKVSIVPFATDVNVGTGNVNATWIDWTDWDAANGTCSNTNYNTKSSCQSHGKIWTPEAAQHLERLRQRPRPEQRRHQHRRPVAGAPATLFRAHQADNCPTAMMPLTDDWTALNAKIDAMTPTGNTNVTIGLAWGFQTLSPVAPFNAPAPAPDLDKVIILLTDGENTQNRWSSSASAIDARTRRPATTSRPPTSSSIPCA